MKLNTEIEIKSMLNWLENIKFVMQHKRLLVGKKPLLSEL